MVKIIKAPVNEESKSIHYYGVFCVECGSIFICDSGDLDKDDYYSIKCPTCNNKMYPRRGVKADWKEKITGAKTPYMINSTLIKEISEEAFNKYFSGDISDLNM